MHVLAVHLNIFFAVINILIAEGIETEVNYDQSRLILNAKEQLNKNGTRGSLKAKPQPISNNTVWISSRETGVR
jgi:hypothetical protein